MKVDFESIALKISKAAPVYTHNSRVSGRVEFVKDTGPIRRDIRVQGFSWSPDSLRTLVKILWAAERAHSYGMAALRHLSKMPSSEFSPDGLLGGRGYIQSVKDMRSGLSQAVEVLSSFSDTIHDEINADHWAGVPQEPQTQNLVQDAESVKADPDGFVENSFDGSEHPVLSNPSAEDLNPEFEGDSDHDFFDEDGSGSEDEENSPIRTSSSVPEKPRKKDGKPGSGLPSDDSIQGEGKTSPEMVMNTTTPAHGNYASAVRKVLKFQESRMASARKRADSSIPVGTLPGPRIDHVGPAAGNEAGHFNHDDVWPSDDPVGDGFSHNSPIYEDGLQDGVTGYDNVTDGDETVLKISVDAISRTASYSWLPGSRNEKNLDYYALGLSAEDVEWMRAHSDPDVPKGLGPEKVKSDAKWLWDSGLR